MKKKIVLSLLLFVHCSHAQQETQFNNASFNPYVINPAASGMTSVAQFEAAYRSQWIGYNGGPNTVFFTGHSALKTGANKGLEEFNIEGKSFYALPKRKTGAMKHTVGGKLLNDAIGPFAKSAVHGSYALHLPLVKKINLSVGIGLGWSNFRIDQSRVILHQEDDVSYSTLLAGSTSQNFLDASAGLMTYDENFFFGFSTTQLFNNGATFEGVNTQSNFERHYFLQGAYIIKINENIGIEPNLIGKFVAGSPSSFDIGARLRYNNSAWINLQYRTSNAAVIRIGATLTKGLYLGYGYEVSTGKLAGTNSGSHEIQLGLLFGNNRNLDKEIKQNKQESEKAKEAVSE